MTERGRPPEEYFGLPAVPNVGYRGMTLDRSGFFVATSNKVDVDAGDLKVWIAPRLP